MGTCSLTNCDRFTDSDQSQLATSTTAARGSPLLSSSSSSSSPGALPPTTGVGSIAAAAVVEGDSGDVPRDQFELAGARILQINLNKSKIATSALNDRIFDVALVQEPNLSSNLNIGLISAPRRSFCVNRARAAVIVDSSTTNYWPVTSLSTRDLAVVIVDCGRPATTIVLAAGYLDILQPAVIPEMVRLVDYCECKGLPLLMGLDSNAHSTLWGSDNLNQRGERLEDFLMSSNLFICNVGNVPTFAPSYDDRRRTVIDITITNERAALMIADWKVCQEDDSFSDHRLISYSVANCIKVQDITARVYRKANWRLFHDYLDNEGIDWPDNVNDLEIVAGNLHRSMREALDLVAPRKTRRDRGTKSWWTSSLYEMRNKLKTLYRKRGTDKTILSQYRALKKTLAAAIKAARRRSWQDFCSRADSASDISKLVQILEASPEKRMSLLTKEGEILAPEESLKHLLQTHFPEGYVSDSFTKERGGGGGGTRTDFTGVCQFVTPTKVARAFKSFGDYKSPGPDELPPIALKNLPEKYYLYISLLYQLSLATGRVPELWRTMRVVFIPKAGKTDYAAAKAYRPITLSNFLLKGLERLIQWFILETAIPTPLYRQHAYTKGRSCDTALSTFINDVEKSVLNGQLLLAISLDCSGASDCIKFSSAEKCMARKGIPMNIVHWYNNLLQHRYVSADIQGQHKIVVPARGSPQGGVLSPLVWNLIMDSFLSKFEKGPIKVLGYADDILLYIAGIDTACMSELLQEAVDKVVTWGDDNGLNFNPKKTKMVLFTRKRHVDPPRILLGGEEELELSDSFKYLGMEIQKGLNWTKHINERVKKCKYLLLKCRGLIGQKWGLSPEKIEWIHKSIIRPKITYGSIVWANSIKKSDAIKLCKLQRLALLLITRPLRSAPTAGLQVLLGWLPLDLHALEMGMGTYLRINDMITRSNFTQHGHLGRWSRMAKSFLPDSYPRENRLLKQVWIEAPVMQNRFFPEPVRIYTDASKEDKNVGYAWVASDGDYMIAEDIYSGREMSVFYAEVMAIKEALSWIKSQNDDTRSYEIYSDSLSAVNVLNGYIANGPVICETMELFKSLSDGNYSIKVAWTKGHANTTGNEYADALARSGAKAAGDISYTTPYTPITTKMIKTMVQGWILGLWQEAWDRAEDYKVSRLFYPSIRGESITSCFNLAELQTLSMIVTGHGLWKKHLRHWKNIQDYSCSLCGEDWEYPWHLWALCPSLNNVRQNTNLLIKKGLSFERALLRFFQDRKIKEILASNEAAFGLD